MCLEVVLVVLAVFWFIPLAVMSAVFGEKFRDNVARFVSPRSIDTKTAAD